MNTPDSQQSGRADACGQALHRGNRRRASDAWLIVKDMGPAWMAYRAAYALKLRSGWFRKQCPAGAWSAAAGDVSHRSSAALLASLQQTRVPFAASSVRTRAARLSQICAGPTVQAIVSEIDDARFGRLRFFGGAMQHVGWPPAWHVHPRTQTAWPQEHWSCIGHSDSSDVKWLWEPARFGLAFLLVRASCLTGDPQYAEAFWELVEDWRAHNPPNTGVHWVCGQECALRSIAWIFALFALLDSKSSTPARVARLIEVLEAHARRIEGNLGYARSQKNNHSINEALALWAIASLVPGLEAADRWERIGRKVLEDEAARQIYDDGSYVQQSLNYHLFVLQSYGVALELGRSLGRPFSQALVDRYRAAAEFLWQLTDPQSGRVPNYGANDSARLFRLDGAAQDDARPTLALAFWAADRRRVFEPGPWDEPLFWISGDEPLDAITQPLPRSDLRAAVGGYYTLRGGDTWALTRCTTYRDRPAQADMLHLDIWWRGANIVGDPGSGSYHGDPPWDNGLSATIVHNTVTVDERDQMDRVSPFLWVGWNRGRIVRRDVSPDSPVKVVEGEHDGYRRHAGVVHRRAVVLVAGCAWIVVDDLRGDGAHRLASQWIFPDAQIHSHADVTWLLSSAQGPFSMSFFGFAAATSIASEALQVTPNPTEGPLGWYASGYGAYARATSLVVTETSLLPVRRITVIALGEARPHVTSVDATAIALAGASGESVRIACRAFPYPETSSLVESVQFTSGPSHVERANRVSLTG